jgi:hypothetical protein
MSSVGFEPTIPVLVRATTVHALDRAATVTGVLLIRFQASELEPGIHEAACEDVRCNQAVNKSNHPN